MRKPTSEEKKVIIAIALIVIGIAALIGWETFGRERVLCSDIVVAISDIPQGAEIKEKDLTIKSVPRDLVVEGAIKKSDIKTDKQKEEIIGKVAARGILQNEQLSQKHIYKNDFFIKNEQALFKIPAEWIASRSSALRRGDLVSFWTQSGENKLGEYRVAFVKNESEAEVANIDSEQYNDPLDRTASTAYITSIEIIATVEEYQALFKAVMGNEMTAIMSTGKMEEIQIPAENKLLLVQEYSNR